MPTDRKGSGQVPLYIDDAWSGRGWLWAGDDGGGVVVILGYFAIFAEGFAKL